MSGGRWIKGQSGNPKGRSPRVKEDLERKVLLEVYDEAAERDVITAMIGRAKGGDVKAAEFLDVRKYGTVTQKVQNDNRLTVEWEDPDADTDSGETSPEPDSDTA